MQYFALFFCSCVTWAATVDYQTISISSYDPEPAKVVVLSFGGLRTSVLKSRFLKYLPELYKKCARPEYMTPVFPTKTPVNLFSIATGLYAEKHGVIYNCEFDEPTDQQQHCQYEQYDQDLNPIWIENQLREGISGVYRWPGSQNTYQETVPIHRILPKDDLDPSQDPLDLIIRWLTHNTLPANLVMAHFDELDKVLHEYGPISRQAEDELKRIDELIYNFIRKLEERDIIHEVNLIILGSQGIHSVWDNGGIDLSEILHDDVMFHKNIPFISMGTNAIVYPDGDEEMFKAHHALQAHSTVFEEDDERPDEKIEKELFKVYRKDKNIPNYWHLNELPLLDNTIFLVAQIGYHFWNDYLNRILEQHNASGKRFEVGLDGYSNGEQSMKTVFMALGPNFKPGERVEDGFETVDVYPLLRKLLGLKGYISKRQSETNLNYTVSKLLSTEHEQMMYHIRRKLMKCLNTAVCTP